MSKDSEIKINHLEGEKISHFKSLSGVEYQRIYDQKDWSGTLPDAGEYPFVRGVHKDMSGAVSGRGGSRAGLAHRRRATSS